MSQSLNSRPEPLTFDFEQWRRDIETFVAETNQDLQTIIADLSGAETPPAANGLSRTRMVAKSPISVDSESSGTNQRLATLKEKLSKRIQQPRN